MLFFRFLKNTNVSAYCSSSSGYTNEKTTRGSGMSNHESESDRMNWKVLVFLKSQPLIGLLGLLIVLHGSLGGVAGYSSSWRGWALRIFLEG